MAKIIQIDFKKIDDRVKHFLKEKKRRMEISTDDVIALLASLEGVSLPLTPARIVEPKGTVDLGKVYSALKGHGNQLFSAIIKLDIWLQNYKIINGAELEANKAKVELAKILVNFA
jgi:hypothetical protein